MNPDADVRSLSPLEAKILRLLVYAHPASLNINFLRHRLILKAEPSAEAESLVFRGLIEPVPPSRPDNDAPEWRATRRGIWHEENAAVLAADKH